jgi:hypothetical protein
MQTVLGVLTRFPDPGLEVINIVNVGISLEYNDNR